MDKRDVEREAMVYAQRFLKHKGYKVTDVARTPGHNGYDLLAEREGEKLRIEVKGCTREWGIPDPFFTEFDADRRLVADYLYVVYFLGQEPPRLCIIPRDAIDPDMVQLKQGYRISGRFKKATMMQQYMQPAIKLDD